jgi:glycosyltransferase involved in cell wall biosynthesis
MRTGINPAKAGLPAYQPQTLGVATIVYIPSLEGYFEHSLEILKYTLASLRATIAQPFDLLVFDNGSCSQVVDELCSLRARGWIDWLILSRHNLGKAGAWNWIFSAMPNEILGYTDSDVLFRPGWLEASLEILESFPQAGMISAQPNFYDVMKGEGQAHLALQGDERYAFTTYWPAREIVDEYCLGIGASEELAQRFYRHPLPAVSDKKRGVQAVIGASHMQFVMPRQVARQVVPLPATRGLLHAETKALDYKVDQLGYLHLSTQTPYVFHMGNNLNERLLNEVQQITSLSQKQPIPVKKPSIPGSRWGRLLAALARRPRLKRGLVRLYNLLFQVLYTEDRAR